MVSRHVTHHFDLAIGPSLVGDRRRRMTGRRADHAKPIRSGRSLFSSFVHALVAAILVMIAVYFGGCAAQALASTRSASSWKTENTENTVGGAATSSVRIFNTN